MALLNAKTGFTTSIKYYEVVFFFIFFAIFFYFLKFDFLKFNEKLLIVFIWLISAVGLASPNSANNIFVDEYQTPVASLIKSYFEAKNKIEIVNNEDFKRLEKTFFKNEFYSNQYKNYKIPKDKNIIVIFTEGMSSRWYKEDNINYSGLMPNLHEFGEESLVFENYYNHTAATFRGLRGQIMSSHQHMGGWHGDGSGLGAEGATKYYNAFSGTSLHGVLKKHGYESYFFLSQENHLNEMLETMGFDGVYGLKEIFGKYGEGAYPDVLSDKDLFGGMLKTLEGKRGKFISFVYNFDTHNGLDGGIKYKNSDNEVLNRFHTYDHTFGDFLRKFKKSKLSDDTVIIFTADHSTFPDKHARAADPGIPTIFVDQIPLMIYYDGIQPGRFDAKGQTSIALAPSIINFLNLENEGNYFFGCSLFDFCEKNFYGSIGDYLYKIVNSNIVVGGSKYNQDFIKIDGNFNLIVDYQKINNFHGFNEDK